MLNSKELHFLTDTDFLLTKAVILKKLQSTLFELQPSIREIATPFLPYLPEELSFAGQKIAKGDNYLGLPYLVMDYPKRFEKQHIFTVRSMVWWGNEVSCTLHLQGKYWHRHREVIMENLQQIDQQNTIWICINDNPWEYHFNADNYVTVEDFLSDNSANIPPDFLKLSHKLPLSAIEDLPTFILSSVTQFLDLLTPNHDGKRHS